jgi:hypothetical protein
MSQHPFIPADFEDSLLELVALDAQPRKVQLASVHRPSFSQQLTVLRDSMPDFANTQPPTVTVQGVSRKSSGLRALDLPN